jgi:hypothetical protein
LYIRAADERIIAVKKDMLNEPKNLSKHYIDVYDRYIDVIDADIVRDLLLDSMGKSNNTNWVGININDKLKLVNLKDKSKEIIRRYFCFGNDPEFLEYAYHVDYESEEFYALVFFICPETGGTNFSGSNKCKIYLFKDKIENLYRGYSQPRLLFVSYPKDYTSEIIHIYSNLKQITINDYDYGRLLQICGKKLNTVFRAIGLRIFKMYDKNKKRYYDYKYHRVSITIEPQDSSLFSTLHLVRRIMPIF